MGPSGQVGPDKPGTAVYHWDFTNGGRGRGGGEGRMPLRFTVLASGSGGNASLLEADGFGVLIDAGLGPRQLAARMAAVGASWRHVHAVLLTHTHGDHWKERTLAHLRGLKVPLYCHPAHQQALDVYSQSFPRLRKEQLVRTYQAEGDLELTPRLRVRPVEVR